MPQLQEHVSLTSYHTFGLDVRARWMLDIRHESDAIEFFTDNYNNPCDMLLLGGGSNVLFLSDYEGVVLRNHITGTEVMAETDEYVLVKVGGGENWHQFVIYALNSGWYGIENLSLIPGSVGAAPIQNIGAYGVEIEETFDHLEAIHVDTCETRIFTHEQCQFGYRDSFFKREGKGRYFITRVAFRLSKVPHINISYGAIRKELDGISQPTPSDVSDAVIRIRQSKLPDPAVTGNAGSFFKNPEVSAETFQRIMNQYPDAPSFPVSETTVKVPAAWLIQTCGWKGVRRGDIGVHPRQALVLVNYGAGTGQELFDLSEEILQSVKSKFGIELEREVQVIG